MGPRLGDSSLKVQFNSAATVLIFEGNSLMMGYGAPADKTLPKQLQTMHPVNGMAVSNFAVGGSTWKNNNSMTARAGAVDALYSPGKEHILVLWEDTNTLWNDNTLTGEVVALQAAEYIAARKVAIPGLKVIKLTTISRYGVGGPYGNDLVSANNALAACDTYTKAHYRELGIDILVDVRASGTFDMSGTQYMKQAMKPYIDDPTHLNEWGYGLVAQQVANALTRITAR